jgi:hypothetical protein
MLAHLADLAKGSWRYATGLRGFLSVSLELEAAQNILKQQLQRREETFLRVLERGVYGNPKSPYRRLLVQSGFQYEDVRVLIQDRGLEKTLGQLHEAGVYVTLDEFKGRTSIKRPNFEFAVSARDFDNPLLQVHYEGTTGGSRGGGTRIPIDFDSFANESASLLCSLYASGVAGRPAFLWRPEPPGTMGLRSVLLCAGAGFLPEKWLSPSRVHWNRQGLQGRALMIYTLVVSRLFGRPLPRPRFAGTESEIVAYLADAARQGTPALMLCGPSQWVRICQTAELAGVNIEGTVFYGGGEPYTDGKAAVLHRTGARALSSYGMQEAGSIGLMCGSPFVTDDMHFMSDRLAMLQHPVELSPGIRVNSLLYTTLTTTAPKLMLNVESGDYGVIEERDCGCLWQRLGFTTHIHHVHSYEKLTSDGVMFMGSMLHDLLEQTLPARFGGSPLDYQLVEEEEEGLPRVSLVVSPEVGPLEDRELIETVLRFVGFADWSRRQADQWRQTGTLRIQRRKPYVTRAGKILPLHVLSPTPEPASEALSPYATGQSPRTIGR